MTPVVDTIVDYSAIPRATETTVLFYGDISLDGRVCTGFVVERTPFHPLDPYWPDQPGDLGEVIVGQTSYPVISAHVVAARRDEEFLQPCDLPKRGEEGFAFLVWHEVPSIVAADGAEWIGESIELVVDADRRQRLSAVHTAAHLMAAALNEVTAEFWRKPARLDGRGNPDFDQNFISRASIGETTSTDVYRLGKSARKAGFEVEVFASNLDAVATEVSRKVNAWIGTAAPVEVIPSTSPLMGRREWHCYIPEETISIPCGGTHVDHLARLGAVTISLSRAKDEPNEFEIRTFVDERVIGRS